MTDFTNAKTGPKVYPEQAIDADYQRTEPLITPEQLLRRFLMGIDLSSQMKDPLTGKSMRWTADMIKDIIDSAFSTAEAELGVNLRPVVIQEKHEWNRIAYAGFGFMALRARPVSKIIDLSVVPASGESIYSMPKTWIETAYMPRGQINVIPMTASMVGGDSSAISPTGTATGGSFYLTIVQNTGWVPAYWQVTYLSGYDSGCMPRMVNDLLGCIAATDILSMLAATYAKTNSHSLSIDSLSQSQANNSGALFNTRITDLEKRRTLLVKKLKSLYGRKVFASNV